MTACEADTPLNAADTPLNTDDRAADHVSGADLAGDSYRPLNVVDVLFFAPIGLALRAGTLIPDAIENGRKEYEKRRATANVLGTFIVTQHRRKRRLAAAEKAAGASGGARPHTTPPVTPAGAVTREDPTMDPSAGEAPTEAAMFTSANAVPAPSELPIDGYDTLPARSLIGLFEGLTTDQRATVERYERAHRRRETVLMKLRQLDADGEIDQPG